MANYSILNYSHVAITKVEPDEFNKQIDFCQKFMKEIKPIWARREGYFYCKYMVQKTDTYIELRYFYHEPKRYRLYMNNSYGHDQDKMTGYEAYTIVEDKWQQNNETSKTIFQSYSGGKYRELYRAIKHCVPEQIAFIDNDTGKVINNCYKADKSSAFPSQLIKSIPTLHDYKEYQGTVEPTEDYPFAFYLKSHHIKIYNELDTRKMNNFYYKKIYEKKYDDSVKPEDDITILCKVSEYSFKETFTKLYEERSKYPDNKIIMNAFIGYCHRNGDPRLSHVAAVVIARNNYDMLQKCLYLEDQGNVPIYIATDSIVWIGNDSDVCTREKYLGSFTFENKGKFFGRQVGAYQFLDDDGTVITKCSYIANGDEKENLKFGELPLPKVGKIIIDSNYKVLEIM